MAASAFLWMHVEKLVTFFFFVCVVRHVVVFDAVVCTAAAWNKAESWTRPPFSCYQE